MWVLPRLNRMAESGYRLLIWAWFSRSAHENPFQGTSFLFPSLLPALSSVFLQRLKVVYEQVLRSCQICDPKPDI